MSRAENDAYWGSTDTASAALDNFFDEDILDTWTLVSPTKPNSSVTSATSTASIVDNITSANTSYGAQDGDSDGRGKLSKGVGKAIGEKLDSWKPPSVSIKWNSQGPGEESCMNCAEKNEEIFNLKKRLESSYSKYDLTLAPEDMVSRILLGQPFSIENYRGLGEKLELIDAALSSLDSSAILVTVLHLKNTVKKSIFIKEMQSRPHAVQVYIHYLKQRYNFSEAIDLLGSLGKHEDAAILAYKWTLTGKSSSTKIKNINKSLKSHFQDTSLAYESNVLKQHVQLLERQLQIEEKDSSNATTAQQTEYLKDNRLIDSSLLSTLLYCCTYHWDAVESHHASPLALRKTHNISDRQLLWTALRGRAEISHWPLPNELESWMGSKGVMGALTSIKSALSGSGRLIKATLPIDQVVYMLQSTEAPSNVLAAYISLVDSLDVRLKLAVNCKSHQAVIDVFVAQKDRDSLEKYMKEIPAGSPEYLKADGALKNVRWKN